ncbi:MAG TPA: LLM class flavin-dependent oxidoreductase [Acidimicrobiales bacterium]|nr:LLM class flavin-dependent oxidoreductase [Acidimicrobiales bacterium]
MSGDPYVAMGTAIATTTTIRMSTGVTNPLTRHPVVTASAIMSADIESGGRVELGVGRGDSALAHIGLPPVSVEMLREFLEMARPYLQGDAVPIERAAQGNARRIDEGLPLGTVPRESRLMWLDELAESGVIHGRPSVPIWVVASGPRTIELAARLCDRVTLAVGANPERVRWAVDMIRGINPDVAIGAYVTVVVDDDPDRALALSKGGIATFVRFSGMHGQVHGSVSEDDRRIMMEVPRRYDMYQHARTGPQADVITRQFAERFAIIGPAGFCTERLEELAALGIDRFHITGASRGQDEHDADAANRRFVDEVMAGLAR